MIDIITYNDKTVQALYDALLYDSIQSNGIITGMEVDILASGSSIPISDGFGIIEGRVFQVSGETVDVNLTPGETTSGQIILKIDLSNTEEPISIFSDNTMRPLVQNSDFNIMEGTWEEQIATYTVDTTSVYNIVQTFKYVSSINDIKTKTDYVQSTLTNAIQSEAEQRAEEIGATNTRINNYQTGLAIRSYSKKNITIGANTNVQAEVTITLNSNERLVGYVDKWIDGTGTTSSANISSCLCTNWWGNGTTKTVSIRNFANSQAKVTLNVSALIAKVV